MELEVVDGDLLDQDVEVLVNAWNRNVIPWWLLIPQGVSRALERRAGSGGFAEGAALELMTDELSRVESAARVRVVRFRP